MLKFLSFLLIFPFSLLAQSNVSGRIVRSDNKTPVAYASVFFSNSSKGTTTLEDGSFVLANVKNGEYDLVVTCIGYETYHQNVSVFNANIHLLPIKLQSQVNTLHEVKIVSEKKRKRQPDHGRYVQMFTRAFFGSSKNAAYCKLLNPDVLDFKFDLETDELRATSHDFMILENKALGYRIKYLLKSFLISPGRHLVYYTGSSIFIPMDSTAAQKKIWKENRLKAYFGSEMQFLRGCIARELPEDGFVVRKLVRTPIEGREPDSVIYANIKHYGSSPDYYVGELRYWQNQAKLPAFTQEISDRHLNDFEFAKTTDTKGIYAIGYKDCLLINYGNPRSASFDINTIITFTEPFSYFDSNGIIINPRSNTVEGNWGDRRVADLLPVDYEPSDDLK